MNNDKNLSDFYDNKSKMRIKVTLPDMRYGCFS